MFEMSLATTHLATHCSEPRAVRVDSRPLIRSCQQAGFFRFNEIVNPAECDQDVCADVDAIVEVDDVARAHADATEAGRCADPAFLRCSVDINATIARGAVLRFHSSQPDHA